MFTDDQQAALLMVIADLRIQLANALGQVDLFKKIVEEQRDAAAQQPAGEPPGD